MKIIMCVNILGKNTNNHLWFDLQVFDLSIYPRNDYRFRICFYPLKYVAFRL